MGRNFPFCCLRATEKPLFTPNVAYDLRHYQVQPVRFRPAVQRGGKRRRPNQNERCCHAALSTPASAKYWRIPGARKILGCFPQRLSNPHDSRGLEYKTRQSVLRIPCYNPGSISMESSSALDGNRTLTMDDN